MAGSTIVATLPQELMRQEFASDQGSAQARYERLFLYVFKLLTRFGLKTLAKTELQAQLEIALNDENTALIGGITSLFGRLEVRVTALEQGQISNMRKLLKLR
jgi:hypothetical protein